MCVAAPQRDLELVAEQIAEMELLRHVLYVTHLQTEEVRIQAPKKGTLKDHRKQTGM